jgi:branched-chain amino acid transport system substrate-binding protein
MNALRRLLLVSALSAPICRTFAAGVQPVFVGLDAEFGHTTSTSAQAIRLGIEIAIDEINQRGGVLNNRPLRLVTRDNASLPALGVKNLRELSRMPELVAVFGGRFSPVFLECLPVAHELGIPLLSSGWASADGITEHSFNPSYTFRLSLKDSWVMAALIQFARQEKKAKHLAVLLPNTSWGRSNKAALDKLIASQQVSVKSIRWYNGGDNVEAMRAHYVLMQKSGADAIILVANEAEAAPLIKEIATFPSRQRLPIISHWGISGGNLPDLAGEALHEVDLSVIQSFTFFENASPLAKKVLAEIKFRTGVQRPEMISGAIGIAQAYDLMQLLGLAIEKAGSTDRMMVRQALEHLPPYAGLIKTYTNAFTHEKHDALGPENWLFARYTRYDALVPIPFRGH